MIQHAVLILALTFLACTPAGTGAPQPSNLPIDPSVAAAAIWDDGMAEVATYASKRVIYGVPRAYDYVMITVKEDLNRQFLTKTDSYDRSDLVTVLKVNLFARIPTTNYPYHFLTSLFVRRDAPELLVKATASSSEWCGNTFKNITNKDSAFAYTWDSYWDGEGVGSRQLENDAYLEDHLFVLLRCLKPPFQKPITMMLFPSITTSKAALGAPERATISATKDVLDPSVLDENSGYGRTECVRYDVTTATRRLTYWIAMDGVRTLLRFEASDGRLMELSSCRRAAYWNN